MQGWITLPKSVTKERIISNAQVFDWEISDTDMKYLDSLECYGVTGIFFFLDLR
jgi:methylglyoxal/glyoxal reductase